MLRTVVLTVAVAIGGGLAALPSQGAASAACASGNVALDGYKLVHLQATGVSCAKARSIARTVAGQLHRQGGISISGIAGFSMSTQTCTGCGTTTQVSLSYASGGRVTVSLRTSATPGPVPFPGSGQVTI